MADIVIAGRRIDQIKQDPDLGLTPYDAGALSANATIDWANGTYQKGTISADITNITHINAQSEKEHQLLILGSNTSKKRVTWTANNQDWGSFVPPVNTGGFTKVKMQQRPGLLPAVSLNDVKSVTGLLGRPFAITHDNNHLLTIEIASPTVLRAYTWSPRSTDIPTLLDSKTLASGVTYSIAPFRYGSGIYTSPPAIGIDGWMILSATAGTTTTGTVLVKFDSSREKFTNEVYLTSPVGYYSAISPNSRYVAYRETSNVYVYPFDPIAVTVGSASSQLISNGLSTNYFWSPTSNYIFTYTSPSNLIAYDVATINYYTYTSYWGTNRVNIFSPGGTKIMAPIVGGDSHIYVYEIGWNNPGWVGGPTRDFGYCPVPAHYGIWFNKDGDRFYICYKYDASTYVLARYIWSESTGLGGMETSWNIFGSQAIAIDIGTRDGYTLMDMWDNNDGTARWRSLGLPACEMQGVEWSSG